MMRTTTNNISRLLNLELLRNQRIALSQMSLGRNPLHFLALAPRRLLKKTMMMTMRKKKIETVISNSLNLKTSRTTSQRKVLTSKLRRRMIQMMKMMNHLLKSQQW